MSTYVAAAKDAGDKFLRGLGEYQEMWLQSISAFSRYRLPALAMPGYASHAEAAKANFEFLERLLAQQQKFAVSMYKASTPASKKPAAKKKARPAAKRKTTKRATTKAGTAAPSSGTSP